MKTLKIIGISCRTTNLNHQALNDLGALWDKFFKDNILSKIPNKINEDIYSVYTDYESNYKGYYTCIIGLEVDSLVDIPSGMVAREFKEQKFKKFIASGEIHKAVAKTWNEIWDNDDLLNRTYLYDYELYTKKAQNPNDAQIEIYIGVK